MKGQVNSALLQHRRHQKSTAWPWHTTSEQELRERYRKMVRSTGAGAFLVMLLLSLLRQTAGFAPMVSLAGQRPPPVLSTSRSNCT